MIPLAELVKLETPDPKVVLATIKEYSLEAEPLDLDSFKCVVNKSPLTVHQYELLRWRLLHGLAVLEHYRQHEPAFQYERAIEFIQKRQISFS